MSIFQCLRFLCQVVHHDFFKVSIGTIFAQIFLIRLFPLNVFPLAVISCSCGHNKNIYNLYNFLCDYNKL